MKKKEQAHTWKGGRIYEKRGYVKLFLPEHPQCDSKGYVYEHRYVMEKHLGRPLIKEEDIHHINGVKDDNRIENLELHTRSSHLLEHRRINQENVIKKRVCSICSENKTYYEKKTNQYRWVFDKITKLPVCGRCNARLRYQAKH